MAGSIAVHAIFFLWLFAAPNFHGSPSAYQQLIKPEETRLVWYNFKAKLPDVSPRTAKAENRPLRADTIAEQSIVAAPKDAPPSPQVVFHPAPELKPEPVRPLPNLLALSAPPPPRREFQPPIPTPARAKPQTSIKEAETAPELKAQVQKPAEYNLPHVARPFTPPPERTPKLIARMEVSDAPVLTPARDETDRASARAMREGSRTFALRPSTPRSITASVGNLPDAPALASGTTSSKANVAVVGLNAIEDVNVKLPEGSRRGQFAAGPKLNPHGADSAGTASGITVPDLTVRGGDKDAAQRMIAEAMSPSYNAPTSAAAIRAAARDGVRENARHPTSIESDIRGGGSGTRVSGSPDPRFLGRQVFSVALQSPNLTSHEGSWLMWYADRTELNYRAEIAAPRPVHKVDPKYIATAAEEKVEGVVRLAFVIASDGHVYGIETVKGIDTRLDRSAVEALGKWQFTPATREGRAIAVDALVEIPFRLKPPEPK